MNVAYKVCCWCESKSPEKSEKTSEEREGNADEHRECCNKDLIYKLKPSKPLLSC